AFHVDEGICRPEIDRDIVYRYEGTGCKPAKSHFSPSKLLSASGPTRPPLDWNCTEVEKLPRLGIGRKQIPRSDNGERRPFSTHGMCRLLRCTIFKLSIPGRAEPSASARRLSRLLRLPNRGDCE